MSKVVHISEAASLAVHSMALIATNEEMLNVNNIAEITKSSRNHLAKVMHILVKNDYLTSTRGPKGGFILKKEASAIDLLQLYELMEGPIEKQHCGIYAGKCPFSTCVFGNLANRFSEDFIDYLKTTKLSDIIRRKIK
ncbi:MAG: Rrf2 family transcriptional regulator [Bacteroidota bacterium]|nr:Rrf2 family transcriptional regulator [Bacteroidota bacterium]